MAQPGTTMLKRRDRKILRALTVWGDTMPGELARELNIPRRTLYRRLDLLESLGCVSRAYYGPVSITVIGMEMLDANTKQRGEPSIGPPPQHAVRAPTAAPPTAMPPFAASSAAHRRTRPPDPTPRVRGVDPERFQWRQDVLARLPRHLQQAALTEIDRIGRGRGPLPSPDRLADQIKRELLQGLRS